MEQLWSIHGERAIAEQNRPSVYFQFPTPSLLRTSYLVPRKDIIVFEEFYQEAKSRDKAMATNLSKITMATTHNQGKQRRQDNRGTLCKHLAHLFLPT